MFLKLQRGGYYFVVLNYASILVPILISPYVAYKEVDSKIGPIYESSVPIVSGRDSECFLNCNEGAFIQQYRTVQLF